MAFTRLECWRLCSILRSRCCTSRGPGLVAAQALPYSSDASSVKNDASQSKEIHHERLRELLRPPPQPHLEALNNGQNLLRFGGFGVCTSVREAKEIIEKSGFCKSIISIRKDNRVENLPGTSFLVETDGSASPKTWDARVGPHMIHAWKARVSVVPAMISKIDESAGRVVALRNVPTTMTKRMVKDLFPFSNLSDTDIEYYNRNGKSVVLVYFHSEVEAFRSTVRTMLRVNGKNIYLTRLK